MKTMLLSIFLLFGLGGFSQTVNYYDGNGNEQFGGAIGKGKLTIEEMPDSVYFTLTRGPGLFDSLLVFYMDAQAGGISSIAGLTGGGDKYLSAAAGENPASGRSALNFPSDFLPDASIVLDKDGGKFFFFLPIGPYTLIQEVKTFTVEPSVTNSAPKYTQKFAKADVGLTGNLNFKFIGTYIGQSASRSNEAFGDPFNNYGRSIEASSYSTYNVTSYYTFATAILPVKLTDFKASKSGNSVNLAWSVAQESNIDDYQVQRSKDGISFSSIAVVKARNSPAAINYTLTDRLPLRGTNYYRLLINERGVKTYSNVFNLRFDENTRQFSAFFNSTTAITICVNGILPGTYGLSVVNSNGQVVISKNILTDGNTQNMQVQMPQQLPKGIYRVVLQSITIKLNTSILVQ